MKKSKFWSKLRISKGRLTHIFPLSIHGDGSRPSISKRVENRIYKLKPILKRRKFLIICQSWASYDLLSAFCIYFKLDVDIRFFVIFENRLDLNGVTRNLKLTKKGSKLTKLVNSGHFKSKNVNFGQNLEYQGLD